MNTHYPLIPKSVKEIPLQMVYPYVDLPPRPKAFKGLLNYIKSISEKVHPKGSPREITEIARRVWGDEK